MNRLEPNIGTGKYIFLSYPHKNVEHAYKIIEALQSAGYRVWFDEGLELGTGYNQTIAEHIEECEVFMCLLTTEYYQSDYCRMEFNFALEECKKRIIPVFMGNASQIKKSFPAGMRMYLAGVNAFLLAENVDIDTFMHKIARASILRGCREEKTDPRQKRPVAVDRFDSLRKANARDIVTFGRYPQGKNDEMAPIEWIVLDRRGGYMLLISKCALDSKPYHEEWVDVTWETCTLRKWLNEGFLSKAFDAGERKVIGVYGTPVTKNTEYKTNPGNATKDRVFLLGIDEAKKYFINDNERKCKVTFRALVGIKKVYDKYGWKDFDKHFGKDPRCAWWLCSPRSISNRAALVSNYGNVFANCCDVDRGDVGVRPVLRLVI